MNVRKNMRLAVTLGSFLVACTKPAPEPSKASGASDPGASAQSAPVGSAPVAPMYAPAPPPSAGADRVDELVWEVPTAWSTQPNPNTMRKATYKVKRSSSDAEDAECAVSQAGGALEDNIKRWQAQFEGSPAAKRTEKKIAGLTVTIVEIQGTFLGSGMGPGGEKKAGMSMLAAIVATEPAHFFKLVGPTNTVNLAKPEFDKLLSSVKKK